MSPQLTPHTSPTAPTACPTPKDPPSSDAAPSSSAQSRRPQRSQVHVPLGLLVAYEGMCWSPAPEPSPQQRPPVPASPGPFLQSAPQDLNFTNQCFFGGGGGGGSYSHGQCGRTKGPCPPESPDLPWRLSSLSLSCTSPPMVLLWRGTCRPGGGRSVTCMFLFPVYLSQFTQ